MPTVIGSTTIAPLPHVDNGRAAAPSVLDRSIMALSRDMISVLGYDGLLHEVNAAWQQLLGYEPAELLGRTYLDLIHPDDHDLTRDAIALLALGQPVVSYANRCLA